MTYQSRDERQKHYDALVDAARRDEQIVDTNNNLTRELIDGVVVRHTPTYIDKRGMVFELLDERWPEYKDAMTYAFLFTVRPKIVKGWSMHFEHEDRYCLIKGEMLLVLYDPRPSSPTFGKINEIYFSEHERKVVNIPIGVWHADLGLGTQDAVVVNFPTMAYRYDAPDKIRLPIETDLIPYRFPEDCDGGGWPKKDLAESD
ncbi:MAG: dTDP-4-dehydrorhamnose 3,5-epimerase family protein [Pseudomonadota bacterium]